MIVVFLVLSLYVHPTLAALTGSGASETVVLETVSPVVEYAEAVADNRVVVQFREALLLPAATGAENYTISGPGTGTCDGSPSGVAGSSSLFELNWNGGEMHEGDPVTLSVREIQDLLGNPVRPEGGSTVFAGKGTPPVFGDFLVIPPEAASDETVVLRFSTSEPLVIAPKVSIRGNAATFSSLVSNVYVFHYRVRRSDSAGPADIRISGTDMAGNGGMADVPDAFEIVANEENLPVSWFWVAVVLVVTGVTVLYRRQRCLSVQRTSFLFAWIVATPFACGFVSAQAPSVTNVVVSQSPGGATGTKVDVYFDLVAPDAPCDILLSLSKDHGVDGYPHRISRYSGDLADVTTGRNRHIVWEIRSDYPEEYIPAARILVTAHDENIQHSLFYLSEGHGAISNPASQTVNHGEDGISVTATPEAGYHFSGWSDGLQNALRQDTIVTGDISVTAAFEVDMYAITCNVSGSGTCTAEPSVVPYGGISNIIVTPKAGWYVVSVIDSEEGTKEGSYTTTPLTGNRTIAATFAGGALVSSFAINAGTDTTPNAEVTLDITCPEAPVELIASESPELSGATWKPYEPSPAFILSPGLGQRTVYLKVRNFGGESEIVSDSIFLEPEMVPVAAGRFDMGRTSAGDDMAFGTASELPVHEVTLDGYAFGKYATTNGQYCSVLNYAFDRGYLKTENGASWSGSGGIYGGNNLYILVDIERIECNMLFVDGKFVSKNRNGLPDTTNYSMENHPVVSVSWYGAVAFCNWLSEWQGLPASYDMNTAKWPLALAPPLSGGYRLPTEAEWERAAAWDGRKHWIYGFYSDNLAGNDRCNYGTHPYGPYVNPLGLKESPYTSPVGWFNGLNVSPNGGWLTIDSPSPVGAYDMSGNVWEWCQDWYSSTYYSGGTMTNPTGPPTGATKVLRGGAFRDTVNCRTACRDSREPDKTPYWRGFRIARTP